MANPICLSPLKFYDKAIKQNHRKSYAFGHIAPLVMKQGVIDSFQFVLPPNVASIAPLSTLLMDAKTDSIVANVGTAFIENGLAIKTLDNGVKVLTYPGTFMFTDIKYEGIYYLIIGVNPGLRYVSEVFCFSNSLDDYLELEYWNPEADFSIKGGAITFADNFHFKLRLCTELGKPEYKFEEEATKRLGYTFIESQVSSKVYKFNCILPEYLCDALRLVRLCSNKKVTSKGEEYDLLTFDMEVDWQDQGDLASVTCELEVDNVIANLGGYRYEPIGGDFNNDYNNDYKIK